ncbi:MAG: BlaI/MecI/CopY family transcriptional regulator [Verrucomicrobiota bacterium]
MSKSSHASPLELQVLSVLWANGPSTVRDVHSQVPDGRDRAYTTVLAVLQNMERKGLVSRRASGKAHVYKAKKSESQILQPLVKDMINNVFGGNPGRMIEMALGAARLRESEKKSVNAALRKHKAKAG